MTVLGLGGLCLTQPCLSLETERACGCLSLFVRQTPKEGVRGPVDLALLGYSAGHGAGGGGSVVRLIVAI